MGPKHSTVVIYGAKISYIVAKLLLIRKYSYFFYCFGTKKMLLIGVAPKEKLQLLIYLQMSDLAP
jgi:hypothetical protein